MASESPKVLISYSHDSLEHARRVLGLAERLRKDGVEAWIDQYVTGTPGVTAWTRTDFATARQSIIDHYVLAILGGRSTNEVKRSYA